MGAHSDMLIVDVRHVGAAERAEAARILVAAFARVPSAWKQLDEAAAEVDLFVSDPDRRALLACDGARVLGWVGGIAGASHAWELHPLVVDPPAQGRGVGKALVAALERTAANAGALTVWLGTDDEFGGTTLFGRDLYPDPLAPLMQLAPTAGHPFTFYQRLGYAVCGVIPDADGPGRHDILMAKRIAG